jgi:hypothetical protein
MYISRYTILGLCGLYIMCQFMVWGILVQSYADIQDEYQCFKDHATLIIACESLKQGQTVTYDKLLVTYPLMIYAMIFLFISCCGTCILAFFFYKNPEPPPMDDRLLSANIDDDDL